MTPKRSDLPPLGAPPADDLFSARLRERLAESAPLADRLRPRHLDEVVGQRHLLAPGAPLRAMLDGGRPLSMILWGPPGTGKTTLARLVAGAADLAFAPLSAVSAGVKDVRETVEGARRRLAEEGRGTILFLDEVHRFNKAQQDALLPAVEDGTLVLVGATTENPFFEVNAPLLSRTTLLRLEPLSADDLSALVDRGLEAEGVSIADEGRRLLVDLVDGDARALLTSLEVAAAVARQRGATTIERVDVEAARGARALRYGVDDHYDVVSAFIKSIRGSDPDAGLYWLARMLEAGEDARFVARRLVILASEDVGMADPHGLVLADAAARAVEFVGLPEAALNLAHCVVYLATAPKSNSVTMGLIRATTDVRERPASAVPAHLQQAHPREARTLGTGTGYRYPHDDPRGWVEQEHRPPEVAGRRYYEPSQHGAERAVGERMRGPGAGRDQTGGAPDPQEEQP